MATKAVCKAAASHSAIVCEGDRKVMVAVVVVVVAAVAEASSTLEVFLAVGENMCTKSKSIHCSSNLYL